jgi:flagellar hook assembly protein FlgD
LDQNPKGDYTSLSIFVNLAKPAPIIVRVLDTRGMELLPMYNGPLGPGHWVFEWDGRLPNGKSAPAGFYVIEVRSGLYSQRKTVQIH